jgi:hypothetical protein
MYLERTALQDTPSRTATHPTLFRSVSDSATRISSRPRQTSDSVAFSDSASRSPHKVRSAFDSIVFSDAASTAAPIVAHVSTTQFASRIGSIYSELGLVAFGGDVFDQAVVTWIRSTKKDLGASELDFGSDEGGIPVVLRLHVSTILKKSQAAQAQKYHAILVGLGI